MTISDWLGLAAFFAVVIAGFVVVITGEIMTMPGLPKVPSSEKIFLNEDGQIEGLF